jgi:hypothetical protein
MRPVDRIQLALLGAVVALFVAAELARGPIPIRATILSMIGWGTFAVLFFVWLWQDCGIGAGILRVARLVAFTAVAFAVFYAFYRRSELLRAGTEIDATFTFIGLHWFMLVANPITFAGISVSFAQFPMALLGHLPAFLVGFDRLGPFAIHVAIMLQVAMLLAVLTIFVLDDRPLVTQAATVAAAAAVFCSRFTVLVCNLTGYAIPSVALGIIFLVTTLDDQPFAIMAPRVGGLLMLAVMHHYPGVFFVLPLVILWVISPAREAGTPLERLATFMNANIPLIAALLVLIACVAIRPELLLPRIQAVAAPTLNLDEFRAKVIGNWTYLTRLFPHEFVKVFFRETPGSWHLLNIPPLGGLIAPIVVTNWVVTALTIGGRRGLNYGLRLVLLGVLLLFLTGLQHLVTGFENYRDMVLLLGMATPGIGFVLAAPRARPSVRALATVYAATVMAYQFIDVAHLQGKHYPGVEYAPAQQAQMEALRRFWRHGGEQQLRGSVVEVVAKEPFPLQSMYQSAAREHGITLEFVSDETFCAYPSAVADKTFRTSCGRAALAVPTDVCTEALESLGWPTATTGVITIYFFESACEPPLERDYSFPEIAPVMEAGR